MRRLLPLAFPVISIGCGNAQPRPGVAFRVSGARFAPGDGRQEVLATDTFSIEE